MRVPLKDRLGDPLPRDARHLLLPAALRPVLERQVAGRLRPAHTAGRAKARQPKRVLLDELVDLLHKLAKGLGVGILGFVLAAHGDRLQVLGADQRPHATPPGGPGVALPALHDVGQRYQPLSGRADARHLGLGVGLGPDLFKGVEMIQPPHLSGRPDFGLAVVDPHVDRLRCPPGDDQAVVAGKAQLGAPVAAHVGLVPDAGQRRAAAPRAAAAGWRKGAGEQPVKSQQRAGRIERIQGRVHLLLKDLGGQSAA